MRTAPKPAASKVSSVVVTSSIRRPLGPWVEEIRGLRWASSAKASRCKLVQLADPRLTNLGLRLSTKDAQCCSVVGELLATPQRDGTRDNIRFRRRTLRQQRWVCLLAAVSY